MLGTTDYPQRVIDHTIRRRGPGRGSGLQVIPKPMAPRLLAGKDDRVQAFHPDADASQIPAPLYIPPSRTLDLSTDRAAERYIKRVRDWRKHLSLFDRAMNSQMPPRLAGGAQAMGTMQGPESQPATAAVPMVPFDQASKRGVEPGPTFTFTLGAGSITLGPTGMPAQGYLRMIEIDVKLKTSGTGAGGKVGKDSPFGLFEVIRFQDTNGNQLDDLPGFPLFLDNVFGCYAGSPDPRLDPFFENTWAEGAEKYSFSLYLVRELAPNGFGAIANMSASQAYKLTLRVAPTENVFGLLQTKPATTQPELECTVWAHFWQLPDDVDMLRRPQVQTPPFHGTTQYRWWAPEISVTTSTNLTITQTGNEIRNIILVGRKTGTPFERTFKQFPEPFQFRWDTELLLIAGQRQLRKIQRELVPDLNSSAGTPEGVGSAAEVAGVIALPFNFGEGRFAGGSGVNSWLPTVTATRLQVTGTATEAGTISVLVNDVSVAETNPALRPVTPGPGGYVAPTAPRLTPTG